MKPGQVTPEPPPNVDGSDGHAHIAPTERPDAPARPGSDKDSEVIEELTDHDALPYLELTSLRLNQHQHHYPEKVIIIGGGPAGLSAAIYAARAGLSPLVVAPDEGGQLLGKGVGVENFPGIFNEKEDDITSGKEVVQVMRKQALACVDFLEVPVCVCGGGGGGGGGWRGDLV
jgi:NADPH-dependent 2,4-dienoyl-CoA reductase/sulfur reductase-like enzyme